MGLGFRVCPSYVVTKVMLPLSAPYHRHAHGLNRRTGDNKAILHPQHAPPPRVKTPVFKHL